MAAQPMGKMLDGKLLVWKLGVRRVASVRGSLAEFDVLYGRGTILAIYYLGTKETKITLEK